MDASLQESKCLPSKPSLPRLSWHLRFAPQSSRVEARKVCKAYRRSRVMQILTKIQMLSTILAKRSDLMRTTTPLKMVWSVWVEKTGLQWKHVQRQCQTGLLTAILSKEITDPIQASQSRQDRALTLSLPTLKVLWICRILMMGQLKGCPRCPSLAQKVVQWLDSGSNSSRSRWCSRLTASWLWLHRGQGLWRATEVVPYLKWRATSLGHHTT